MLGLASVSIWIQHEKWKLKDTWLQQHLFLDCFESVDVRYFSLSLSLLMCLSPYPSFFVHLSDSLQANLQ